MGNETLHAEAVEPVQAELGYTVMVFPGAPPQEYLGLIYGKWMRSLRYGNDYFKLIDPNAYYTAYKAYITALLARPETVTRLAVLTEDRDVVLGFSVCRGNVLDYVHVLRIRLQTPEGIKAVDYRRKGIGVSLVPKEIDTFTHVTKTALSIWASKCKHWKFNPFA